MLEPLRYTREVRVISDLALRIMIGLVLSNSLKQLLQ